MRPRKFTTVLRKMTAIKHGGRKTVPAQLVLFGVSLRDWKKNVVAKCLSLLYRMRGHCSNKEDGLPCHLFFFFFIRFTNRHKYACKFLHVKHSNEFPWQPLFTTRGRCHTRAGIVDSVSLLYRSVFLFLTDVSKVPVARG